MTSTFGYHCVECGVPAIGLGFWVLTTDGTLYERAWVCAAHESLCDTPTYTCEHCGQEAAHTTSANANDPNSAQWCADCMTTTETVYSACDYCGLDIATQGLPTSPNYCPECIANHSAGLCESRPGSCEVCAYIASR